MTPNSLINIAGALILVALVTTIVAHPNTPGVIGATGNAFSGAVSAAIGNPVVSM